MVGWRNMGNSPFRSLAYVFTPSILSGLLAQMEWYRVILDEAQFIRTRYVECQPRLGSPDFVRRTTRASLAAARLRSKYRWMLSGTPVTNSL